MPIYAYRCSNCGHAQDALQKLSDPVLTVCPACGQPTYVKQVTAAGFQLKGSGWYVTDFRGDNKSGKAEGGDSDKAVEKGADKPAEAKGESSSTGESKSSDAAKKTEGSAAPAAAPAAPSPAPAAPVPAPSSGKPSS